MRGILLITKFVLKLNLFSLKHDVVLQRKEKELALLKFVLQWNGKKINKILLSCFNGNEMHSFFNKKSYNWKKSYISSPFLSLHYALKWHKNALWAQWSQNQTKIQDVSYLRKIHEKLNSIDFLLIFQILKNKLKVWNC